MIVVILVMTGTKVEDVIDESTPMGSFLRIAYLYRGLIVPFILLLVITPWFRRAFMEVIKFSGMVTVVLTDVLTKLLSAWLLARTLRIVGVSLLMFCWRFLIILDYSWKKNVEMRIRNRWMVMGWIDILNLNK